MFSRRETRPAAPLVFIHIPKTAGTSLSRALAAMKPWRSVMSDAGNISRPLLDAFLAMPPAERGECLLLGHAMHDSFDAFDGATTLTVIRDPEQHAVSNYLHIRRDPDTPLHDQANALPFADFVRHNWQFLVFQSISLDVTVTRAPIATRETFFDHVPAIFALLDRIDLVGTTDALQDVVDAAARRLGVSPPAVDRLNRAVDQGTADAEHRALRDDYRSLGREPDLAPLVAVERLLYETARRRGAALRPPVASRAVRRRFRR